MHPGEIVADRFEDPAALAGSGGMGAVYRARDRLTGEDVALKTLFREGAADVERFAREASLLAELRHPGVVRYVTHGVTAAACARRRLLPRVRPLRMPRRPPGFRRRATPRASQRRRSRDVRFEVTGDEGGLVLLGERDVSESTRTLLGRETPCVGREVELRTLDAVFAECVEEPQARAVLVTAPAGVGKSRLRHEFLSRLARSSARAEVWIARGDPMSAGSPFGLLARAIGNRYAETRS